MICNYCGKEISDGTAICPVCGTLTERARPISASVQNDSALLKEIILSLLGIFGIGWLIAGETTVGIVLLLASFLIYWPMMLLGTFFTLGLGLICLGPLAISAIIVNAVLLNTTLNRRARRIHPVMPPPAQMRSRQW
ncbi:MAG: zinc ribbon domain-containing protein [Ktedonobacteraceae bacterium]|nr:zinc ribbon domain-containing protein [Ktedonobacteraceae bacterium]